MSNSENSPSKSEPAASQEPQKSPVVLGILLLGVPLVLVIILALLQDK